MEAALASMVSSMPLIQNYAYPGDPTGQCQGQGPEKIGKERKGEAGAFGNDVRSYLGQGDARDTSRRNGLVGVGPIISVGTRLDA